MVTMPFGKHQDQPLNAIPTSYLRWLLTIDLSEWLEDAVRDELELRGIRDSSNTEEKRQPKLDVSGWYRKLSLRFHPDRGGSKEAMQAVNVAKELLEEMLE